MAVRVKQGKGTADHLMSLGDWLCLVFFYKFVDCDKGSGPSEIVFVECRIYFEHP